MMKILLTVLAVWCVGCGVTYQIHNPSASQVRYETAKPAQNIVFTDARHSDEEFSYGRVNVDLEFDSGGTELDYLRQSMASELGARGVPVAVSGEPLQGRVLDFAVRNRRVTGWSPMVTFTRFSADFTRDNKTVRIVAYSKQVKMPAWSMNELAEPCYNRPLRVVVGEVAAKLNRHFIGARASAQVVEQLWARSHGAKTAELLEVANELGWSNHPAALPHLQQLSQHESEEVRGAALGAIGTLALPESLPQLQQIYEAPRSDTDRFMALKAIGDLAAFSPAALTYLQQVQAQPGSSEDNVLEITKLFLDQRPAETGSAVAAR